MQELIEIWEKRVKHYEKLIETTSNSYSIERLYASIDTFKTCIDELKRTLAA